MEEIRKQIGAFSKNDHDGAPLTRRQACEALGVFALSGVAALLTGCN